MISRGEMVEIGVERRMSAIELNINNKTDEDSASMK